MNITLIKSNSRIGKMSRRRQKIALKSRPQTLLVNAYPIAAESGESVPSENGMITLTMSFNPQ